MLCHNKREMLKASELRTGNYLAIGDDLRRDLHYDQISAIKDFYKVMNIDEQCQDVVLELDYEQVDFDLSKVKPIPLTEEWLLKFGFDSLGTYGFGIGKFHVVNRLGKWCFPINHELVYLKHVHQLQNLYFALAGEELQITKQE